MVERRISGGSDRSVGGNIGDVSPTGREVRLSVRMLEVRVCLRQPERLPDASRPRTVVN